MKVAKSLTIFSSLLVVIYIIVMTSIYMPGISPVPIGIAIAQLEEGQSLVNQTAKLVINTDPPYSNVEVIIDGNSYRSGETGNILFTGTAGSHSINIPTNIMGKSLVSNNGSNTFLSFGRWMPFMPKNFTLTLNAATETYFELGLIPSSRVSFDFLDANSNPINKSKIEKIILVSNKGDIIDLKYPYESYIKNSYYDAFDQIEITETPGNLIITSPRELISNEIKFRVTQALMDGINVIDSRKQREFFPTNSTMVNIYLKVFPLEIELRDRIFGESLKGMISLENIEINRDLLQYYTIAGDSIVIPQLPRATYIIKVEDKIGLGGTAAVALSKPQNIVIDIVSYKSILVISLAITGILIMAIILSKKISKWKSAHESLRTKANY